MHTFYVQINKAGTILLAIVGTSAVLSEIIYTIQTGNPFGNIVLLPNYAPHPDKIIEWFAAYFLFFRKRYGNTSFFVFLGSYGALEVFFNSVYLLVNHPALGQYPITDAEYPLRLLLWALLLTIGLTLGQLRVSITQDRITKGLAALLIVAYFIYNESTAIFVNHYTVITNGQFTIWNHLNDTFANLLWLALIWAIIQPRHVEDVNSIREKRQDFFSMLRQLLRAFVLKIVQIFSKT